MSAAVPENVHFCFTVVLLCALWYSVSSSAGVLNKTILSQYPYPFTVSMVSLISISLYSLPLMHYWRVAKHNLSLTQQLKYILPIGVGKAVAVSSAYVSLWKVPVSYAHTVKATMPIFAVICARVILGEVQSYRVYISLIPIVAGVIIATATELSFNTTGLLSALTSTFTYALLNSITKKTYQETQMPALSLLSVTAQVATVLFLPVWCLHDALPIWNTLSDPTSPSSISYDFVLKLLASGALSFVQNLCAFTLIDKLNAISYAVANTTKRITVITVSLLMLRNPVTSTNVFGMLLAIIGVLGYNRAKQSQKATVPQSPGHSKHLRVNWSDASLGALANGRPPSQNSLLGNGDTVDVERIGYNGNGMARANAHRKVATMECV